MCADSAVAAPRRSPHCSRSGRDPRGLLDSIVSPPWPRRRSRTASDASARCRRGELRPNRMETEEKGTSKVPRRRQRNSAAPRSSQSPASATSREAISPTIVLPEYVPPEGSLKSRAPGRQNIACKCVLSCRPASLLPPGHTDSTEPAEDVVGGKSNATGAGPYVSFPNCTIRRLPLIFRDCRHYQSCMSCQVIYKEPVRAIAKPQLPPLS